MLKPFRIYQKSMANEFAVPEVPPAAPPVGEDTPPSTMEEAVSRLDVEVARRLHAEHQLREIEERFRQISEHAGKFMWVSDPQTNELLYVSPGYEQVWARTRETECATPAAWTTNFRNGRPRRNRPAMPHEEFYQIAGPDGEVRWIRDRMFPIRDEEGRVVRILGVAEDITDAKKLREALVANEQKWRGLASVSPDMVFRVRRDGTILEFKPGTDPNLFLDETRVLGKTIKQVLPSLLASETMRHIGQALRAGEVRTFECQYLVADEVRDFEVRGVACASDEVLAVVHDITDRKRLEREIVEVSSREQQRIGEDLHDGLGQHLTAITFLTRTLERRLAAKSLEEAKEAAEIGRLVMQALTQTRNLARGLVPAELERNGLIPAIAELASRIERTCKVRCTFEGSESVVIDDLPVKAQVFRIAQEAINNSVKHGKARLIEVTLKLAGDRIELTVTDDGVGIPPDAKMDGLGMRIMHYRARKIGGSLDVTTPPKGGTRVTCSFRKKYESN
jgi:PAS domain S-box-containing protein